MLDQNLNKYKLHNERQNEYLKQLQGGNQKQAPLAFPPKPIGEDPEGEVENEAEILANLKQAKYKNRPTSSKMSRKTDSTRKSKHSPCWFGQIGNDWR